MRPLLLALVLVSWLAAPAPAEADDPAQSGAQPVGKVAATEGKVAATLGADTRTVVRGEAVYRGDWIETEKSSRAKIVLHDETELVVGPGSRIHLDEFVYDAGNDKGKVLVEMGVGLLRFTSGVLEPDSYEVRTPVASIGVRGTIFDTIVAIISHATTVIVRQPAVFFKTFGGSAIVDKKDHASSADSASDEPEPQRPATDEEEKLTDPLKKPFKDEIPITRRPTNLPGNVPKPNVSPHPSQPNIPSNRPSMPGRY